MAEPEHVLRAKLTAVFARQDFYEACKRRDAGAMIRILNAGGITQGQIAARTGFARGVGGGGVCGGGVGVGGGVLWGWFFGD